MTTPTEPLPTSSAPHLARGLSRSARLRLRLRLRLRSRSRSRSRGRGRAAVGGALVGGAIAVGLVALAACSGSSTRSSSAGGVAQEDPQREPAGIAVPATVARADASTDPDTPRAIVRTASMSVAVADVDASANRIAALASQPGERVDGDQRASDGDHRTAELTLRVLPSHLGGVLSSIGGLGLETARNVQGEDVTTTKVDIDARILALTTSVARLQTFLSQSSSVPSLLLLEKQLSDRQADLDALRAKQRALGDQITLATLTVSVSQRGGPVAAAHPDGPRGFGSALASGWHSLVTGGRYILAGLGYALPATTLAASLAVVAALVWRRRRRADGLTPVAASSGTTSGPGN